jgi:Phage integrase, N-terminal SAM-like domain
MELPRDEDKELIADFIVAWSNDSIDGHPMATNTKAAYLDALVRLARYHEHKKSFKEMTRDDIFAYLNSMKKDFSQDIQQRWVNTYNARGAAQKCWSSLRLSTTAGSSTRWWCRRRCRSNLLH